VLIGADDVSSLALWHLDIDVGKDCVLTGFYAPGVNSIAMQVMMGRATEPPLPWPLVIAWFQMYLVEILLCWMGRLW
jgi:hypothetical protein